MVAALGFGWAFWRTAFGFRRAVRLDPAFGILVLRAECMFSLGLRCGHDSVPGFGGVCSILPFVCSPPGTRELVSTRALRLVLLVCSSPIGEISHVNISRPGYKPVSAQWPLSRTCRGRPDLDDDWAPGRGGFSSWEAGVKGRNRSGPSLSKFLG